MSIVIKHQAIRAVNSAVVTIRGDDAFDINDNPITYDAVAVQTYMDANAYKSLRQYPSLGDQLDMLWHAIDNGTLNKTSDFYTAIKAVKDAHPKE